jgi:hypothetical protein
LFQQRTAQALPLKLLLSDIARVDLNMGGMLVGHSMHLGNITFAQRAVNATCVPTPGLSHHESCVHIT